MESSFRIEFILLERSRMTVARRGEVAGHATGHPNRRFASRRLGFVSNGSSHVRTHARTHAFAHARGRGLRSLGGLTNSLVDQRRPTGDTRRLERVEPSRLLRSLWAVGEKIFHLLVVEALLILLFTTGSSSRPFKLITSRFPRPRRLIAPVARNGNTSELRRADFPSRERPENESLFTLRAQLTRENSERHCETRFRLAFIYVFRSFVRRLRSRSVRLSVCITSSRLFERDRKFRNIIMKMSWQLRSRTSFSRSTDAD